MRARRGLANVSTDALELELRRRKQGLRPLERARDRLAAKLARLESRIQNFGGSVLGSLRGTAGRRAGGARPRNEMNLVEALARVLKGKTMSVTEVAGEVQRAGYRTSSANFRTIVNQTLIKSNRFRKVSRGKYTAR